MESPLDSIRRIVFGTSSTETAPAARTTDSVGSRARSSNGRDAGFGAPLPEYDPDALSSRRDFVVELGMPPEEFFPRLVAHHDGALPQKSFTEFTDLSSSTISRILGELEDDGRIVRVTVGRENAIVLPERAPQDGVPTAADVEDLRRA
ncbi:helix-turn-helix transcriptional regulator [Halorarum salinum]|uniref:DUF7343 domain-containing protein n=1 Tax=Halorarum salinum TaxID=2743089 RepID=A0A7D5QD52_9EURY|nr:hypothetical protein [Halobaculum salinum]QLG63579.1 hypothetical protein HUG12_18345 [Halobaculum salinum]